MALFALAVVCTSPMPAVAQADVNDVHVTPREATPHDADKAKTEEIAKDTVVPASLNTHIRPLKVAVDLVLVPVTITDPLNRLVTGLDKDNFQLFEGSSKEEIKSFSSEDAPVSLGVIFDSSGSMNSKMDRAKDAVTEFFKSDNPAKAHGAAGCDLHGRQQNEAGQVSQKGAPHHFRRRR
jgi:Ca-activated chloride channel family protein